MDHTNLNDIIKILEKDQKIYEILKDCPYQILKKIKLREYPDNGFSLEQGDVYDTFYIILNGEVDIFVESEQGKKFYLTTYGKGNFIGELELFERKPYMSSVEGRGKVKTLEIGREEYIQWLEKDANFNKYVLSMLCDVTYVSMSKMGENTLYTLKQRICQFIIENTNEKRKLSIALNAELLSERMGVTKRSVNRVIKELKDSGALAVENSKLCVKNYELLLKEKKK